jgi:hypothetical protein
LYNEYPQQWNTRAFVAKSGRILAGQAPPEPGFRSNLFAAQKVFPLYPLRG